jgi:hypothetical protein
MTWRVSALTLLAAAAASIGCGPTTRGAVAFDGRSRKPLVHPSQLEETTTLPVGYRSLGRVSATCTLTTGDRELRGAWLSDVDCTETRLRAAVRERAAAVGGVMLVGLSCASEPRGARRGAERTAIHCRASVARPTGEALGKQELVPAPPARAWGEEAPAAIEAWQIRVDYTGATGADGRAPRGVESVNELPHLPPSHRKLGDLVTRCDGGCSERGVYEGLFAAAGRMGASDVTEVGCVRQGEGWLCTAVAAGYRVDPEQDPGAR